MDIKPIPTKYKGIPFRSRLEARWAVFFDAMGMQYEYEPDGYPTGIGNYLVDFLLPDQRYWVEIKRALAIDEFGMPDPHRIKLSAVSDSTERDAVAVYGPPGRLDMEKPVYRIFRIFPGSDVDEEYYWAQCHGCGVVGAQFAGRWARNPHADGCQFMGATTASADETGQLIRAYELAMAEKFGERGGIA